jgi:beta-lysine 5,6-aminomutase alpha subunit
MMTGQSILLIGMMTEGIHTPFLSDRDLALENVRYVRDAAGRLGDSFRPAPGGFIERRATEVLGEAVELLAVIGDEGLLTAIAGGTFGITRRPPDGGRGLDGVIRQADGYFNPATEILEEGGPPEAGAPASSPAVASPPVASPPVASPPVASTGEER